MESIKNTLTYGWDMVKHVGGKALKWGIPGAIIGGLGAAALATLAGGSLLFIPVIGPLLAGVGVISGAAGSMIGGAALTGAMWGGGIAAAAGGAMALTGATKAADNAAASREDAEQNRKVRAYQEQLLAQQVAAQRGAGMNVSPDANLPYGGRDAGMQVQ